MRSPRTSASPQTLCPSTGSAPAPSHQWLRLVVGAVLAILLLAAQLVVSPTAAQAKPDEKPEKVYVTPADLGDGTKPPQPVGTAWLVGDLDSGELHAAKDIEKRHAPASTIKLLTALALVDVLDDRKQKVEATFEDMQIDGTKVGLMQKNDYTIDLLFHAMLMSSANDAANALGRAAGGQETAVRLMNEKADELGMANTHAMNTSGLDAEGQYTTAADLMKLAWAVCDNDYLMEVIGTETYHFPGGKNPQTKEKFKGYEIQNHTKIVGRVDGGLGLKNGFTRKAKGAYVAVAERDGRRVVSTMLGIDNHSRQAAVDLLEWDFAQKDPKSLQTIPVGQEMTAQPEPTDSGSSSASGDAATEAAGTSVAAKDSAHENSDAGSSLGIALDNTVALVLLAVGVVLLIAVGTLWTRLRRRRRS